MSWVRRDGHLLVLDGKPFYANGWNSYWLMVQAAEASTRPRVDTILRDGAALGLTVCRTWAFNDDTYLALQTSPGKYDEKVFQVRSGFSCRRF
jgi:mannan endo-1,4-beta-mannosidase